jgi:hypothetical protein
MWQPTFFRNGEGLTLGLDLVVADVAELGRAVVVDGFNANNLKTFNDSLTDDVTARH